MSATKTRKPTDEAPAEPRGDTEERELRQQEEVDEARAAGQVEGQVTKEATGPATGAPNLPDIKGMSQEEILALLQKRRGELQQVQQVAKEKGIKVPGGKKTASDQERLLEFINRVGYHTGMAKWALGLRAKAIRRVTPVVEALGEGWDPEKQGEAVDALIEGFREARIQTSFESTSMPEKKVADKVPAGRVWAEFLGEIGLTGFPEWLEALLETEVAAGDGSPGGSTK